MNEVIAVFKPVGKTPLECANRYKRKFKVLGKVSYAGRLDPMASGVLILLVGDENKKRKKYEDLTKEYEVEIAFGVTTDSFDALGLVEKINLNDSPNRKEFEKASLLFIGKNKQTYPPYSSKTVNGKPLYWWARQKRLSEVKMPEREIEIKKIKLISFRKIQTTDFCREIINDILKVKGDFRQNEIIKGWKKFEVKNKDKPVNIAKIKVVCSSGTYMRQLAYDIGTNLVCGAIARSIKRTKVGTFELENTIKV